jgi:pimeloyl-ACP methyl ester carboxylesterase
VIESSRHSSFPLPPYPLPHLAWRMNWRVRRALLSKLALRFPWMVRFLPTSIPVLTQRHACREDAPARSLIVFLPGIGDTVDDYERHGFIDAIKRTGWPADLAVVDAHYGYYANRTILDRLHADIFEPAKALGYRDRWLVGISMGGFGALLYASCHAVDVTGVVAIAPYLGKPAMAREIIMAGGLRSWMPTTIGEHDYERQLWAWLKQYESREAALPELYLAYGERDTFVEAHRLLNGILPAGQVFAESGQHDWRTWKKLWERILASSCLGQARSAMG